MRDLLRVLLPVVAVALACMATLDIWIRTQPLEMPRALQVVLTISLVTAIAALLGLVLRAERRGGAE